MYEKELERKKKAQQDLEDGNSWWDKRQKENNMYVIGVIISTFLILGFWLLLSKVG